jgi:hypothetical protein
LTVSRRDREPVGERPSVPDEFAWVEVVVNGVRFRLRADGPDAAKADPFLALLAR